MVFFWHKDKHFLLKYDIIQINRVVEYDILQGRAPFEYDKLALYRISDVIVASLKG